MVKISTSDQLLLMAYGELNDKETRRLQEQLMQDCELAAEWRSILRTSRELDDQVVAPSQTSLRIVIEHSHHTEHLQEI